MLIQLIHLICISFTDVIILNVSIFVFTSVFSVYISLSRLILTHFIDIMTQKFVEINIGNFSENNIQKKHM